VFWAGVASQVSSWRAQTANAAVMSAKSIGVPDAAERLADLVPEIA
jgi:hypothetical protein